MRCSASSRPKVICRRCSPTSARTISSGGIFPGCRSPRRPSPPSPSVSFYSATRSKRRSGGYRRELQKLSAGDLQRIDDGKFGGKFGGLARDVNAAVERFTHAPGARSEMAGKDLNAILGPSGGSTLNLPPAGSAFSGSTPAPAFNPPVAAAFPPGAPAFPPPPPGGFAPPPLPSFSPPPAPAFSAPSLPQPFSAGSLGASASLPPSIKPAPWSQPQQLPTDALDDGRRRSPDARRRGDARRPLRLPGRGGRSLPPRLRRLRRDQTLVRRADRRPHPGEISPEAA